MGLLGFKTILGTVMIAVGQALETQPPPLHIAGEALTFIGTILTGYGIAHKQAKILQVTQSAASAARTAANKAEAVVEEKAVEEKK